MGFKITGNAGVDAEVDGTAYRALRVVQRPNDPGALGAYRLAAFSGLTTAIVAGTASAGHVFSLRWTDATRFLVLKHLKVAMTVVTGFTAAQELAFQAFVARGYTTTHAGGTAITLGGNNQKRRTSMGSSLVTTASAARIASTTALTGSTFTLDANPFMNGSVKTLAAAATVQDARLENVMDFGGNDHPFVLSQDEGIVVRNTIAMGAAGTVRWAIECGWDELTSY